MGLLKQENNEPEVTQKLPFIRVRIGIPLLFSPLFLFAQCQRHGKLDQRYLPVKEANSIAINMTVYPLLDVLLNVFF